MTSTTSVMSDVMRKHQSREKTGLSEVKPMFLVEIRDLSSDNVFQSHSISFGSSMILSYYTSITPHHQGLLESVEKDGIGASSASYQKTYLLGFNGARNAGCCSLGNFNPMGGILDDWTKGRC